jgi:hypothetical protein
MAKASSGWRFTRIAAAIGRNNRVSTDALGALHAWEAEDARRSYEVTEGLEDAAVMVANLTTDTDDSNAGTRLDWHCMRVGVTRELVPSWHKVEFEKVDKAELQMFATGLMTVFQRKLGAVPDKSGVDVYRLEVSDVHGVFYFSPKASALMMMDQAFHGADPCDAPDVGRLRRIVL